MFRNYVITALRNILKHKGYSLINILGLAIGVTAFTLIMLYVQNELSYDRYHEKSDQIYRVATRGALAGNEFHMAVSPAPVGSAFVEEIPGVIQSTRVRNLGFPVIRYEDKVFSEERWFNADSTFFEVFDVNFIQGDPVTALTQPNTVVLTESTADRYFGSEDPMGKTLNSDRRRDYIITGVVEDPPQNSHFHYDFIASLMTYPDMANDPIWVSNNFFTYLVLDKNTPAQQVEDEFPGMVYKYAGPQIEQFMGVSWEQLIERGAAYGFHLQPLTDIHLNSHLEYEIEPNGNALYVTIFTAIAVFILMIACINFMNLATARSTKRAREVGVRKTLGSTRSQLIRQFLTEAILLSFIAFVIAMVFVQLILPAFNNMINLQLTMSLFTDPAMILIFIILVVAVGLVSGSYPAFFLANFNPVMVLKGSAHAQGKNSLLRSTLVIFQFVISITLFTGAIVVYDQLSYIQNKDLGYSKDQVLIVEKTDDIGEQIEAFKSELRQDPRTISVSNSTSLIGHNFGNTVHQVLGEPAENALLLSIFATDYAYADAYGLEVVKGRFYSPDRPADSSSAVINEAAARVLGFDDPIGKVLIRPGNTPGESNHSEIIGIVKDFHFQSLHQEIRPMTFTLFGTDGFGRYTAVKIPREDVQGTLDFIESVWKKYAVDQPFEYTFLDDDFNQLYIAEYRTRRIVTTFSILAILVACLGLFGLASYSVEQRTKEIGIRKVLGASVPNIYILLSTDILKLILIATALSWPLSFETMRRWLENFHYRIDYSNLTFLIAGLIAFLIAIVTVSTQAIKAARTNPVDSLMYE
ncbi:MAG: ABC transporter permease [Candidatus Neomarinimicrobiota bacterium]